MAERNVNVNINYVTNTSGVTKASAEVKKADQATEKLRKSTKQYEKDVNKAGEAGTKSFSNVSSGITKATSSINGLITGIKLFLAAGLVKETFDLALGMSKLAGESEGVRNAFIRLQDSTRILEEMKVATGGTVSELALMKAAVQANNFQIPIENLAKLFQFATLRAQQTGQSVDYLVESIILGIGRKSPLILDNLGISAIRLQEKLRGVSAEAATVGDVAKVVGDIASEELKSMAGFAENNATKLQRLSAVFDDLKVAIGNALNGTGLLGKSLQFIIDKMKELNGFVTLLNSDPVMDAFNKQMEEAVSNFRNLNKEQQEGAINQLVQDVQRARNDFDKLNAIFKEYDDRVRNAKGPEFQRQAEQGLAFRDAVKKIQDQYGYTNEEATKFFSKVRFELELEEKGYISLNEQLKRFLEIYKQANQTAPPQLGIIATLESEIKSLQDQIRNAPSFEIADKLSKDLEIAKRALDRFKASINQGPPTVDLLKTEPIDKLNSKLELTKSNADTVADALKRIEENLKNIGQVSSTIDIVPMDFADRLAEEIDRAKEALTNTGIDILSDQLIANQELQVEGLRVQLDETRAYYDEQILLAGKNERAKQLLRLKSEKDERAIRIRIAQAEKESRRFSVVIDTAAAIIKAFATLPTPAAVIQSAIIAALGASQLAIINRTPLPKFAKGKVGIDGPGTGTSDSITARISKGESVINADSTSKSKMLLEAINAKRIDDSILKNLILTKEGVRPVNVDTKSIVDAIKAQKAPDLIRHGNLIYEARKQGETYTKIVRSKIFGK